MKPVVLVTAGHIDHGKTALVRALTGVDTDRLPEEKRRGITIDLGFANFCIGDITVAVVDVPGHEGFVRTMLAGATGTDAVLLVVAADEGVMPQTREHVAILDLLGITRAIVAITKSDLADPDWLALVCDDVREFLAPTTLGSAPIIPVSVTTAVGLDDLRTAIREQLASPVARRPDDVVRLPVDRVFTVRGTGTVITGTVWSGTVTIDQPVWLRPAGARARVRGIQVHGRAVATVRAGERAALALAGVSRDEVARGDVLLGTDDWLESLMLTVRARLIRETPWTLATRQRVRVHAGTAEVIGRAVLLEREMIQAGEEAWLQLRLEKPVVARVGDRLVLRSYSPVATIGGGVVAERSGRKRSRLTAIESTLLARVIQGDPIDALAAAVSLRAAEGLTLQELPVATPYAPDDLLRAAARATDRVVRIGQRFFDRAAALAAIETVVTRVEQAHAADPLRPALERAQIRSGIRSVPAELVEWAVDAAIGAGRLTAAGGTVIARDFRPVLSDRQAALKTTLLMVLSKGGLAPPSVSELARLGGSPREVQQLLRVLEDEGKITAVSPDLYFESAALGAAQMRTAAQLGGHGGLTAAEFRATLPVSRKHLIPLLEHFDRVGITIRDGDLRRVVQG